MQTNNTGRVTSDGGRETHAATDRVRNLEGGLPRRHRFRPLRLAFRHQFPLAPLLPRRSVFRAGVPEDSRVSAKRPLGHARNGEHPGPCGSCSTESRPQARIPDQQCRGVRKSSHVARWDEKSAGAVNNQFRKAANAKRDRRNPKSHRVNDSSAEPFGRGGMPEDIESGHGRMNLIDESGANGRYASDRCHPR